MKGFTLVEIALIFFIITILTSISLQYTVFSTDVLYLKNIIYKLSSNINLLRDFSLGTRLIKLINEEAKVCGYGFLITNNSYLGYAYATTSYLNCDLIASTTPQSFAPQQPLLYLHTNGDIREDPIEPLQVKDDLKYINFRISLTSPTCSDNLFSSYNQIALVYYNPYGDLLLLGKRSSSINSWENILLKVDWENIYLCLKYKNEERFLKINRIGQLVIGP